MSEKYTPATHIQTAAEGQSFGVGKYKYQVMNKSGRFALTYFNDLQEAKNYLADNRPKWIEADKREAARLRKLK